MSPNSKMPEITQALVLPPDMTALAHAATQEGHGHVTRLIAEFESGENRFSQHGEGLFVCCVGDRLVGVGGLNQDPYDSNPHAGRVRRVYVHHDYRRQGLASQLIAAIENHARQYFETLNLFTASVEADSFYRRLGYQPKTAVNKISHTKKLSSSEA